MRSTKGKAPNSLAAGSGLMSNNNEMKANRMNPTTLPAVFQFNTHEVRMVVKDGNPWFVAADVCGALGYANASKAIGDHLDADERV